jgi:hypothetical protein
VSELKNKYIEYERIRRAHIRFKESGAEFIPMADEPIHTINLSFCSIIPRICP